jgi:hypothetical protein
MFKQFLIAGFLLVSFHVNGQIQISKIIGKNSSEFNTGYGGYLKFGYPVSDAADVTLEVGANIFQLKADPAYGWAVLPVKAGYRYTINGTGAGFYIEPQVGYNVYGIDPANNKFSGLVLGSGAGYLFKPGGLIQFDLGILLNLCNIQEAQQIIYP